MAIGRTNAGGGGTSLNFKVVGGTTRPTSPKENTIWVNTSVAIPSWAFSATEPGSPVAGMVWIITSTSSQAEFNALKKNTIQVYPTFARQYVGGQWVERDAQCYQDGEWKDMVSELYIVENGILKQEYSFSVSRGNNARQDDGHYSIYGNGGGYHTAWIPNIDLTRYRTLSIDGTFTTGTGWELCVWDKATSAPDYQNHVATADLTATGAVLDVSGLTGEYSVGITNVYTNETLIVNMWLG